MGSPKGGEELHGPSFLQHLLFLVGPWSVLAEAELNVSGKLGARALVFNASCRTSQVLGTQLESHGSSYQQSDFSLLPGGDISKRI